MPQSICNYPGCNRRIPFRSRYCEEHMKQNRLENSREKFPCREWAHLYKNKAWLVRRQAQLSRQPLCEECLRKGRVTLATVADHIVDHKGDSFLFYQGELQSLCPACHSSKTNSDRKRE